MCYPFYHERLFCVTINVFFSKLNTDITVKDLTVKPLAPGLWFILIDGKIGDTKNNYLYFTGVPEALGLR